MRFTSPYITDAHRLAKVIAAIQVMGTYKYYKLSIPEWAKRIGDDPTSPLADDWVTVFEQHPEFFRVGDKRNKASLVWRRTYPKRFDTRKLITVTHDDFEMLDKEQRKAMSRPPLTTEQIDLLMRTAIELHARAIAHGEERRWWVPVATTVFGVILGFLGASVF